MLIEPLSMRAAHPAFAPAPRALRSVAAAALHRASRMLQSLALRLAHAPTRPEQSSSAPTREFHAEAGAPEGALYVDGLLIAHLAGVRRL